MCYLDADAIMEILRTEFKTAVESLRNVGKDIYDAHANADEVLHL